MYRILVFLLPIILLSCTPDQSKIFQAIDNNQERKVEKIVNAYPDVTTEVNVVKDFNAIALNPLPYAINSDSSLDLISFLIEKSPQNSDFNIFEDAIIYSLVKNRYDVTDLLLENFDMNNSNLNILKSVMLSDNSINSVEYLLNNGWNIKNYSYDNKDAFDYAIEENYINIVNLLLNSGIDPNLGTPQDESPLHLATRKGHIEIMRLLLEAGADPNLKSLNDNETDNGEEPIFVAWSKKTLETLYQYGADLNRTTGEEKYSYVSLLVSVLGDNIGSRYQRIFDALVFGLEHGADPNIRQSDGSTPLLIAVEKNAPEEVADLLRKYGAHL